jgi:hypothetical protein
MKIIISESRIEKLALNYIKKQLGEYTTDVIDLPNNGQYQPQFYDGGFIKNGEVTAATDNDDVYIDYFIYVNFFKMINIEPDYGESIIMQAMFDLSNGRKFSTLYIL